MQFDDSGVRARLEAAISRLTTDLELREDLNQEAELHRWLEEALHPGRSEFWHCNKCLLHLRNFLRQGRSVDSQKRCAGRSAIANESEGPGAGGHHLDPDDSFLEKIMAHEDQARLAERLKLVDQEILADLVNGFNAREIAHRRHISRRAVNLRRVIIATAAIRIAIFPTRLRT